MKQISYSIILLFLSGILSAKNIGPSTYGKLKNNAELVVIKDTNSDLRLTMNIKIAPYIEISKNAGISRLLMYTVYCNLVRLDNTYKNTEVIFHPDYSSFVFHLENKENRIIEYCIQCFIIFNV